MGEVTLLPTSGDGWLHERQRAYLICGEDERGVLEAARALRARYMPSDAADFDLDEIEAESASVEDIITSVQREPTLGDLRMVILGSAEVFRRRELARAAERLAETIRHLGPRSCLVMVKRPDASSGKRGAALLTPALDAAVREVGLVVRCPVLDEKAMADWIDAYVAAAGKRITSDAAQRLASRGITDRIAVAHDLDRLIAYVGSRPSIEAADVQAVVAQDPEDVIFRLVDAISARRSGEALSLLRAAARYESRTQVLAGRLLSLLDRQFRLLYQARELSALGIGMSELKSLPDGVAAELPAESSLVSMAWKARSYARDATQWSRADICRAFGLLVACDAANKGDESGNEDVLANLEELVVSLCERVLTPAAGPGRVLSQDR